MSWRSAAQRTGMNDVPLGTTRRWGSASTSDSPATPQTNSPYPPSDAAGSGLPPIPRAAPPSADGSGLKRSLDGDGAAAGADGAPRKRRSRWGDASEKVDLAGLPTAITGTVSKQDLDRYAVQVRLEEISRKLRSGDFVPPDRERSPSPPPTYDAQGRRTNTREVRYRKKLEDERVALVDKQMALDPSFRPPAEYHQTKRSMRPQEKVFLPIKEFPEINFFGLLVGPRGNSLKKMERESGAKISIRGRGSVKEGKGRGGDEDEEEMHCVVTGDDEAKVKKCVRLINLVIETAASTPEGENDHKRNQLRELAALNGTLRDDENQVCQNCGAKGHRKFECPEERNWTAHIICHRCGGQGHLARDCTQAGGSGGPPRPGESPTPGGPGAPRGQFDSEYASLMAELGEGGAGGAGPAAGAAPRGPDGRPDDRPPWAGGATDRGSAPAGGAQKIPPWRNPEVWNTPGGGRGPPRGGYGNGPYPAGGYDGGFGAPGGHMPLDNGYGARQGGGYGAGGYGGAPGGGYGAPQQGGAPDGGQQQQQDYSAEWAAYYAAQGQAGYGAVTGAGAAGAGAGGAAAGAQQDYSKEWEEYYRQQAAAGAGGAPAAGY